MSEGAKNVWLAISGILIGFVNGFIGGGGGILVVAVLLGVGKLPQKEAHATALWVILPLSLVSAIVYFLNGSVDWLKTLYATVGVVSGGLLGAVLLKKLNANAVKIIFAFLMMAAGVRMFF